MATVQSLPAGGGGRAVTGSIQPLVQQGALGAGQRGQLRHDGPERDGGPARRASI
ncbi:hypothetical protein [Parafrankia discariae]|uniref:hypothetical protein n=1 Tax=Parafrankia discariae TaxID=365528 RepID=UPI00036D6271|nr:hypothetical protein [Parafrankia discariae]